ncbi:hypothetical protein [Candidatus Mycobacterium methanotrophicum]|uniref:Uncharacterized protein n=1 Tax=Candidatus Mycobacterium methanotrophicum TaxID=2943498 RepID=A0ABY4QS63_9MYCO|nr:hypothetical protein [Candidatus Mycobacterium methanotrophicum]UQX12841.1 hypothetical protein M5I08_12355 [Candidatus Mycobacterium methanotrophicum]
MAEFVVVEGPELMCVVVKAVSGVLHLVEVVTVVMGGGFLLGALSHDVQFFSTQLDDLFQCLFQIHAVSPV